MREWSEENAPLDLGETASTDDDHRRFVVVNLESSVGERERRGGTGGTDHVNEHVASVLCVNRLAFDAALGVSWRRVAEVRIRTERSSEYARGVQ